MNEGILISPGPREYSNYSEQEKRKKTEEFYREMEEIYNEIDGTKPKYLSRINGLFKEKYKVSELVAVLKEKDAQFLCAYSYDFFILRLLCNIAEMEEQFGECSVFRNVQSIEEIVNKQQKCIFLLRRFEMDWEEDEELLVLMQRGDVSYILLAELVGTDMIVRKVHTGCRVAKYLFDNGLKREEVELKEESSKFMVKYEDGFFNKVLKRVKSFWDKLIIRIEK